MSEQSCPACGEMTSGPYCSHCGSRVSGRPACSACGHELPVGGKFCNQCGTPTPGALPTAGPAAATTAPPAAASTMPWVVAAMAILALVIALVFPRPQGQETAAAPVGGMGGGATAAGSEFGDASAVDISAMSPRERADALFNRVMQNVSAGDSAQTRFFLPMAISAYEAVPDLDADGHYHMAVLHLAGGDPAAARVRADSILAESPDHLFGLFTAAQAEQALGNADAARALYLRFSERFEDEVAAGRAEYSEHQQVMPMMREEARQAVEGA